LVLAHYISAIGPLDQCDWSARSHVLGQNDGAPDVGYRPSNLFTVFTPSSPPSPVPSWERAALSTDRTSSLDEHDVFGVQLQPTIGGAGDGLVEDHSLLPPKFAAPRSPLRSEPPLKASSLVFFHPSDCTRRVPTSSREGPLLARQAVLRIAQLNDGNGVELIHCQPA
jgi:hypothetical protein